MAKLVNCWRESTRKVFLIAAVRNGAEWAMQHVRRIPPKCIGGRWGSCSSVEARLVQTKPEELVPVLMDALSQKTEQAASFPAIAAIAVVDECRLEEEKAYKDKMGRWRKDTLATLADRTFFSVVAISHACHGVLDHLLAFLQQKLVDVDRNGSHLARLVCGKADALFAEFDKCLWQEPWGSHIEDVPIASVPHMYSLALELLLFQAAGFHRRVRCHTRQWAS
eukprot:800508-Lingulodinium_polyedra.AAC.1